MLFLADTLLRQAGQAYVGDMLDKLDGARDMILRYLGDDTTAREILREFGIRTRSEVYNDEHLL